MAKAKAKASTAVAGGKFKRMRSVTLPTFRLEEEKTIYVTIDSPMAVSSFAGKPDKDGKAKEPATVCTVTNVETGEIGHIIVGAVLKGILNETYAKDAYVGKSFEITKHAKANGKRYNTYSLFEIEA